MAKTKYYDSPFGTTEHPWITKPDTKFNDEGLFKAPIWVEGEEGETLAQKVTTASDEALAAHLEEKVDAKDRKKWSVYYPFEREEDDKGNATGRIKFDFKQNAVIHLRDGTTKKVTIGCYDSQDKEMHSPIYGGTVLRTRYSMRPIVMVSSKQVGVRLDFSMVQVKSLNSGGGRGFGSKFEDGHIEDEVDDTAPAQTQSGSEAKTGGSDY